MSNFTTSNVKEKDLIRRGLYAPISFVREILNRIDIVDIINQYLPLKKKGRDYYTLCPFHKEKTASFTVTPTKQFYHCFGCGAHGSAIRFLMEYRGLNAHDAIRLIAKKAGVKTKHVNYYRKDYFGGLDEAEIWLSNAEKEKQVFLGSSFGYSPDGVNRTRWLKGIDKDIKYSKEAIEEYKEAVAIILAAQEKRFGLLFGKNYTEATRLDLDEIVDDKFLPYGEVIWYEDEESGGDYPVPMIENYEGSDREYKQEEIALASVEEVLVEETMLSGDPVHKEHRSEDTEIPIKTPIPEVDKQKEKMKLAEERQMNLRILQEELTLMEGGLERMEDWLESCNYRIQSENFLELQPGDCGKVVLLLDAQDKTFTLIFGERKSENLPRNLSDIHSFFTDTLTRNVGFHKQINTFGDTKCLGGAAYIVLENKRILIGHDSQDFGRIPKGIIQKCIEQSGYGFITVSDDYFLDKKELLNFFLEQNI